MALHERVEFPQVGGQVFGREGGVLPVGPGFGAVGKPGDGAGRRLADLPQPGHFLGVGDGMARGGGVGHLLGDACQLPLRLPHDLAVEPAPGIITRQGGVLAAGAGAQGVEKITSHAFDGGDLVEAQVGGVGGGVDHRAIREDDQALFRRPGHELHLKAGDDAERALRARDSVRHVAGEVVEAVAGDLAREASEFGGDEFAVVVIKLAELGLDVWVRAAVGVEGDLVAVGTHERDGDEVIGGGAPCDGVGAAGVVADHPAHRATRMRRRVRAVGQAIVGGGFAKIVADHAGFDLRGALFRVDGEDAVEIPRGVDDQALANRVARHGRPAAAADDRPAVAVSQRDAALDVVDAARLQHGFRYAAEDRRIRGVRRAGGGVGAQGEFLWCGWVVGGHRRRPSSPAVASGYLRTYRWVGRAVADMLDQWS